MRLTILELWAVGFFQIPFHPGEPYLFWSFWTALLFSILLQFLLLKKCKHRWTQRSFLGVTLVGLLVSEILCQVITGWDLLAAMLLYALFLTFALGITLTSLLYTYIHKT